MAKRGGKKQILMLHALISHASFPLKKKDKISLGINADQKKINSHMFYKELTINASGF